MTASMQEAVLQRLTRLERTLRRWKLAGYGMCALLALACLGGAAARQDLPVAEDVLGRHFILVGRGPSPRASLTLAKDGGPSLLLFDQQGKVRAGLTVLADGRPSLGLLDAQEQSRVVLTVEPDGTPVVRLLDARGQVVWSAP